MALLTTETSALPTDSASPSTPGAKFDYDTAFSRNIGWITEWEQQQLRRKKVAIAGMGGVGSAHLLTLTRLGVGAFRIADLDRYELVNLNRQVGAVMSTLGRPKADVMAAQARDINPEVGMEIFGSGIDDGNIDAFLTGTDLFVDGLDFFAIGIRRTVFRRCAELGIPAITAAPIGFGSSFLIFRPGGMTFERYFRLEGLPEDRQYVNFAVALTPRGFHRSYLVDPSRMDLARRRGPSTAAAIQLCAGIVGTESVKVLLGRGKVRAAPYYHQFDAYAGRWKRGRLLFGNAGPLQSVKRMVGYRVFGRLSQRARPIDESTAGSDIERILDLARWAPSGDNAQPWRFQIVDDTKIAVRIRVEGEAANIYDYNDGQPTLLSSGFLLETMRIAATRFARRARWEYKGRQGLDHQIEVHLPKDPSIEEDPLCPYIVIRSVDRHPYRKVPLLPEQREALEKTLGDELKIVWYEGLRARWRMALLNARATDVRLRLRAAYDVHTRVLDWARALSPDGVPTTAIGLDPVTLGLMRWAMRKWSRIDFMNRFLLGTAIPRLQLDLLPGMGCSGHFAVFRASEPDADDPVPSLLRAGAALQRFWLTATRLGLALQPSLAPLCFAHHARRCPMPGRGMAELSRMMARLFAGRQDPLFLGRIGIPTHPRTTSRSVRKELAQLRD
jgi:molybdopterin/thiamine biosynthesis adenylyltransferase/nitroreductase